MPYENPVVHIVQEKQAILTDSKSQLVKWLSIRKPTQHAGTAHNSD